MSSSVDRWVLVVEDNPDDEHLVRRAFTSSSRTETLLVARNGEEALQVLRKRHSPALVLLDLKLPRLSGVDVLMAMKDDCRLRTVPVVVLTSSVEMTDVGACYDLGCSAFVRKPIDYDQFMSVFSSTLGFWLGTNLTLCTPAAVASD
ncbi:response regulator [Fimbriimonas ginsengisoli]|uniref:response regulator n=1 Tax=Fimbriimonas ginsengisoli TaxID=1005039 RepID=UPI00046CF326|nr:response regulator [Fimbriimonas ginsengisoli]